MKKEPGTFKALIKKDAYKFKEPDPKILETFPNPGVGVVRLTCKEFTSLCPITNQPDLGEVEIIYHPKDLCLEMKSLKLYINSFRMQGSFAEQTAVLITKHLQKVLNPSWVSVQVTFVSRGGVIIQTSAKGGPVWTSRTHLSQS